MRIVIRTAGDPNSMAWVALGSVREQDKDLPLPQVRTMETVLAASIAERRANMLILGVFAAIALLLTGVGIYGVISYSVALLACFIPARRATKVDPMIALRCD